MSEPCMQGNETVDDDVHVGDLIDDKGMMERHLKAIKREMAKKNPNAKVVNVYLDKEFHSRRSWLQNIPAAGRCGNLLDVYPCFKDHVEVQYN